MVRTKRLPDIDGKFVREYIKKYNFKIYGDFVVGIKNAQNFILLEEISL